MKKQRVVLSFPPDKVEDPITYHLIKDYDLMDIMNTIMDIVMENKQRNA